MKLPCLLSFLLSFALVSAQEKSTSAESTGHPGDILAYNGKTSAVEFTSAQPLHEGLLLVTGAADHMDWLPEAKRKYDLPAPEGMTPADSGKIAFLLVVDQDLQKVKAALCLPPGFATSLRHVRVSNPPEEPTGSIFVSGGVSGGYFLAKLNGDCVTTAPTGFTWTFFVKASKDILEDQPWDVGSDGKIVFASGEPHGYNWADVQRLDADGKQDVVEDWRQHWTEDGQDWQGTPASSCPIGVVARSAIVLKSQGRGSLRSWSKEDYEAIVPDGNGGTKQGKWPLDYFFNGPFQVDDPGSSGSGPGYTGYKWGRNPVGHPQAIAIDRRNNHIYLGANNQSTLPDGNPDFEPYVIAFTETGKQKWWSRLYKETAQNSTPDQYVDGLAIDYSDPAETEGALVVLGRCHGNNVINFFRGNEIVHPKNPKASFVNAFTGTNGNIHISWLGRLTLAHGEMLHATYVAEWQDNAKVDGKAMDDPNLDGWPSPNGGWPDVNTTRCRFVQVDAKGRIYLTGTGRRVITTKQAFQKMPKIGEGESKWSDFVRVYSKDLTTLVYSSLVTGPWDPLTKGSPSSNVTLSALVPVAGGLIFVGHAPLDKEGKVSGPDMPVRNVPPWCQEKRESSNGVIGRFYFEP